MPDNTPLLPVVRYCPWRQRILPCFNPRGLLLVTQLVQLATECGQVAQADLSIVIQMAVRPPSTASFAP